MIKPDDILEAIKMRNPGVKHLCPICGHKYWEVDPDVYNELPLIVAVICKRCGLMQHYNTRILFMGKSIAFTNQHP